MNTLLNFRMNGYLIKCDQNEFDAKIKLVFKNMFSQLMSNDDLIEYEKCVDINNNALRCLICRKRRFGEQYIGFCSSCVSKTLDMNGGLYIGRAPTSGNFKYFLTRRDELGDFVAIKHEMFINNLHKLKNEYFHQVPIIFILAKQDTQSSIYILNYDIIMYVLQFIY